ncbi:LacI family DNA-binding transcriptional regulator [Ancylobacter sp. G4_0304]|uniref:LacI family DNA-binding transcriptional regulator n=1 Tax=Ancylobacter sp. G4_0304 TaxID=3114289 RepID=UPI0039C6A617
MKNGPRQPPSGPSERRGGITLSDVAREAGVGESTASRVLRRQGSSALETRERVLGAAERLGYVPNRIAGTLASTGSKLVGIIVPSLANIVFPDLLRGADAVLGEAGFQSVVGVTDYDLDTEERLVESLLSWRPAGLMIAGLDHTGRTRAMLAGAGIRVVEMLDTDGIGIDTVVGFSNREAGRVSARHLLARGYRRIAYIGHDLARDRRAAKRRDGFLAALAEGGQRLAAEDVVMAHSSIGAGREALGRLLARHADIDAVYFSNDDMAIGGYFHCLSQGIAVPERLALFGFNGLDVALHAPQPLSTLLTPRVAIGATSARLLLADEAPGVTTLDFELIAGATT